MLEIFRKQIIREWAEARVHWQTLSISTNTVHLSTKIVFCNPVKLTYFISNFANWYLTSQKKIKNFSSFDLLINIERGFIRKIHISYQKLFKKISIHYKGNTIGSEQFIINESIPDVNLLIMYENQVNSLLEMIIEKALCAINNSRIENP